MSWFMQDWSWAAIRVKEWNEVGGLQTTDRTQWGFVTEEEDELLGAFLEKDKANFLKELCDLFIVSSYHLYLTDKHWFEEGSAFVAGNQHGSGGIYQALSAIDDFVRMKDIVGVIGVCVNLLSKIDADTVKAMQEVLTSNESKYETYCQGCEEEYDNVAFAIEQESKGRYTGVTWKLSNNKVVYISGGGKILKGPSYFKAKVEQYV